MSTKYMSKYSGSEIDSAIGYALSLKENNVTQEITSTPENKVNLDTVATPGNYIVQYFSGGYDDSVTYKYPVTIQVAELSDGMLEQSYEYNGRKYARKYNPGTKEFGNWFVDSDVISAEEDEEVTVDSPTLILRKKKDEISQSE